MSEAENNELTAGNQSKEPRSNQKLKLLYLAKILLDNTDANHDITLDEILNKLHAYDVTAARKSLYDDIAQLNDFGIKTKKTQYGRTSIIRWLAGRLSLQSLSFWWILSLLPSSSLRRNPMSLLRSWRALQADRRLPLCSVRYMLPEE